MTVASSDPDKPNRPDTGPPTDPLKFRTADSPSPYLFESKVEMLGRLAEARTPRARLATKALVWMILLAMLVSILWSIISAH